ncbi:hypothetical protein [Paenibacillus lutimineralis]|uniref:Uncharacterized protein n=1 Tax=Paenibacillus lutimineralis TaxID=2707005 RepID=A0A3S9UUA7_9BACL|nr:hypothetical protein [Paenibacillus lutimineralis]AZS13841.1 hypothetical protein EI981_04830 [Paenibacillus lutimineralis]
MYTYDSFETAGAFTLMRPIFITLLIVSLLLFVIIILPKLRRKLANGSFVFGLSLVSLVVSAQLLYYQAIIVDEIGLGGDEASTMLFLVNAIFCIANPIIFLMKANKRYS